MTCGFMGCHISRTGNWHQNFKHIPLVSKRTAPSPSPSSFIVPEPSKLDGRSRPHRAKRTPLRIVSRHCAQPRAFWRPTACETHVAAYSQLPLHAPAHLCGQARRERTALRAVGWRGRLPPSPATKDELRAGYSRPAQAASLRTKATGSLPFLPSSFARVPIRLALRGPRNVHSVAHGMQTPSR